MLLIDTSIAVELREGLPYFIDRLADLTALPILSIISVVELEGGVVAAMEGATVRRQSLDALYANLEVREFGPAEAKAYAEIVGVLGFSRPRIIDRMIAAQAIVAGASLATLNPRDFRDIPYLIVEDWSR